MDENLKILKSKNRRISIRDNLERSLVQAKDVARGEQKDSKCTHVPLDRTLSLFPFIPQSRISLSLLTSFLISIFSLLLLCVSIIISFFHSFYSVSWVYVKRSFSLLRCFSPIYVECIYVVNTSLLIALVPFRAFYLAAEHTFYITQLYMRDLCVFTHMIIIAGENRDERWNNNIG